MAAAGAGSLAPPRVIEREEVSDDKKIQVNFKDIFKSVQSFGASTFTGKDKKIWEAKQFNALGCNIKHKEKMPFKMYLGVSKARKDRAERTARDDKVAGIVRGEVRAKKARRDDSWVGPSGQPDSLDPDNVRGPIMHVRRGKGKR